MANTVKVECENCWDANKDDCNKFVKSVAAALSIGGFTASMNADGIIAFLEASPLPSGWTKLAVGDDNAAKAEADANRLVIGGLTSGDLGQAHGHVVVVVTGPFDPNHNRYPRAYWGKLGGVGDKDKTLNFAFPAPGRDKVRYFAHV